MYPKVSSFQLGLNVDSIFFRMVRFFQCGEQNCTNEAECFCSASSKRLETPQASKYFHIFSLNSKKGYFPNLWHYVCHPCGHLVSHDHSLIAVLCSATAVLMFRCRAVRETVAGCCSALPLWQCRGILKRFHLMMAWWPNASSMTTSAACR